VERKHEFLYVREQQRKFFLLPSNIFSPPPFFFLHLRSYFAHTPILFDPRKLSMKLAKKSNELEQMYEFHLLYNGSTRSFQVFD